MKTQVLTLSLLLIALLGLCTCNSGNSVETAAKKISAGRLRQHIATLASDEFQGRAPATLGEERTIAYLERQYRRIGILPGNGDSYLQQVPLVEITSDPSMKLSIGSQRKRISLQYSQDFMGGTTNPVATVSLQDLDLIFVGYGIVASEYNWNDYQGMDVKDKVVVILVNDPGYATQDKTLFTGNAMTYYGRWTYKYEEAARQGAAGAIIVHETDAASYPWAVVQNSWSGAQMYLQNTEAAPSPLQFNSWLTHDKAIELFRLAELDFATVSAAAARRNFRAIDLKLKASVSFSNEIRHTKSNNVIGVLPGSERPNEYVIYTAHWDHLGMNPALTDDTVFNGALDNATGTAALIELAQTFAGLREPQKRTVVFLAVTCEEQGLLGSAYYAQNPIYALCQTAAVINMDALNIFGPMKDMTIVGYGMSELDGYAEAALKERGRYVIADQKPERGGYFRSDHFSLAQVGVPSLYLSRGVDHVEHGVQWTTEKSDRYNQENYHKPSDHFEPNTWDLDGLVDDVEVYFAVGHKLSTINTFPNWNKGVPFKPVRDRMMASAKEK